MDTTQLAEGMANLNLETLTVTEMAIISCIKKGINRIDTIVEETSLPEEIVKQNIENFQNNNIIVMVPGTDGDTYIMKYAPEAEKKKYTFKGCLLLPVTSFHDSRGQRWVARGKWYQIPEDCDILNDIEWIDDMSEDSQMKSVMKQITATTKKREEKKAKNTLSNDGPASPEDAKLCKQWVNVSETQKMWVYDVSEHHAVVCYSARIRKNELEFPFGCATPQVTISIEEFHERVENKLGDATFDYNKVLVPSGKNNFPAEWVSDTELKYIEVKPKRGDDVFGVTTFQMTVPTKKIKKLDYVELSKDKISDYIKNNAPLIDEMYSALQETPQEEN